MPGDYGLQSKHNNNHCKLILERIMISTSTNRYGVFGGKVDGILFVDRRFVRGTLSSPDRRNLKTSRFPIRYAYYCRRNLDETVLAPCSSSSSYLKLRKSVACGCGNSNYNGRQQEEDDYDDEGKEVEASVSGSDDDDMDDKWVQDLLRSGNSTPIVSACFVGLFTGIAVVLFNYGVHEIRDLCWGSIPDQGASWLRDEPIKSKWVPVILVPALGGLLVSLINILRTTLEENSSRGTVISTFKSALKPILKTIAACVTLGTGNSLGPEGPSVDIGVSVAKGIGAIYGKGAKKNLSLRASGSAAGVSSGFNAAVAGCFFAVESVLWPAPSESSLSLTNTTSMVILSAVIASVMSEIGLGSEPTFAVPIYDFRSASELPLYLLLGIFCGLVSLGLSKSTSFMFFLFESLQKSKIPKSSFPVLGGLSVGLIALAYPEILYWGFKNVDNLLESRPFASSLSAELLLQVVAAKIVATSLCRASGLVGGYYAPSLFIGAATGMAYGKIVGFVISHSNPILRLSVLEVASPQAYALVGMAATLAGVCQVPLTAVLLLFELTQDYRIVLPLLGAVGLSSWITSDKTKNSIKKVKKGQDSLDLKASSSQSSYNYSTDGSASNPLQPKGSSICDLESSLCLSDDYDSDEDNMANEIPVSQAMGTKFVTAMVRTPLTDVVSVMLEEKQDCAVIVNEKNQPVGHLTLNDIQQFIDSSRAKLTKPQVLRVFELCSSFGERGRMTCTATPSMSLSTALNLMKRHGVSQLPVVLEEKSRLVIGLLDRESVDIAFRAFSVKEDLDGLLVQEKAQEMKVKT